MKKALKNLIIILVVIVGLPLLIFLIYEMGNIRDNEKMIEDIFNNQLAAVVFSVNQYSNDEITSFIKKYENYLTDEENSDSLLSLFVSENWAIEGICEHTEKGTKKIISNNRYNGEIQEQVDSLFSANLTELNRLVTYRVENQNYNKTESFYLENYDLILIVFAGIKRKNEPVLTGMLLNPQVFIKNNLNSRFQSTAKDEFIISVFHSDTLVYSTEGNTNTDIPKFSRDFWILKNYQISIESKKMTIDDLVKERSRRNIYLIILIDLVLLLGAFIIYRNVKKQMALAQIKSDFVSSVSHEIRTPLALISMYIETLEMGRVKSQEKQHEYYGIVLSETNRLSGIVNKILNFSQIESGKRKYSLSSNNLNEIVDDIANNYKFHLENKGFTHSLELDESIPMAHIDREAVTDAVINLVDNAIKYSGDTKHITLRTGSGNQGVYVEIADKGIGISEKDQKLIFDKFYRVVGKNLAYHAKGSGLGLSIVQHIVSAHNAKISVKSKLGEGTQFRITFPN